MRSECLFFALGIPPGARWPKVFCVMARETVLMSTAPGQIPGRFVLSHRGHARNRYRYFLSEIEERR